MIRGSTRTRDPYMDPKRHRGHWSVYHKGTDFVVTGEIVRKVLKRDYGGDGPYEETDNNRDEGGKIR